MAEPTATQQAQARAEVLAALQQQDVDTEQALQLLQQVPIRDWPEVLGALTTAQRSNLQRAVVPLMERAARLYGYIDGLNYEHHERAVVRSNNLAHRVRRLLGYHTTNSITF